MKQITFKYFILLLLAFAPFLSSAYHNGDYGTTSGNWSFSGTWRIYSGGSWIAAATIPDSTDTVYILNTTTVVLDAAEVSCYRLIVESGAHLWVNGGGTAINYIDIYGDSITCNGTIGNANLAIFDGISFDIDGANCVISGSGIYNGSHIRKYSAVPDTGNLTIAMNITLCYGDSTNMAPGKPTDNSAVYNHQSGSTFNITFAAGTTTNLVRYTAGGAGHTCNTNIAIAGSNGEQPPRSGTFTINGTLMVSGLSIISTSAYKPYYANWIINNGGLLVTEDIRTDINCGGSCPGGATLTMNSGSRMKIYGTPFLYSPYSLTNNTYNLLPGSTVEYSGLGPQAVDVNLQYANLTLSGKGLKSANLGTLNIHGNLIINTGDTLAPNPDINIGGNWNDYGTKGFLEKGASGTVTSTVTFNGSTDQTITVPTGESFVNVTINKSGGNVNLDSATNSAMIILDTLNFISGIINADSSDAGYNLVNFLNPGSVALGANNNSFVNGLVKRRGSTPFTYPTGKVGVYRPVTIGSFPDNQTIWAQYFNQNPKYGIPFPSDYDTSQYSLPIHHVSGCEYWTLQSGSNDIADSVVLSWNSQTCGVSDTAGLLVATRDSSVASMWTSLGNGGTSGTPSQGSIISSPSVSFNGNINAYTISLNHNLVPPQVTFATTDSTICQYDCISFSNLSVNASSYKWLFEGAIDPVSTDSNPQNICYATVGNFDVTLVASNEWGSDSVTLSNYMHVIAAPPTPVITQLGDTLSFNPDTSDVSYQWSLDTSLIAGGTGTSIVITRSGNYNLVVTNKAGCKIGAGYEAYFVGLKPLSVSGLHFTISPDPVRDELRIDNLKSGITDFTVYNLLGGKAYSFQSEAENAKQETVIDVSSLPAGIYFLQLKSANESVVEKFVKE